MMRQLTMMAGAGLALVLLAGCERPSKTPIAATVNGVPISVAQLEVELDNAGVPNTNDPLVRRAALQRILLRKLMAADARAAQLDTTARAQVLKVAALEAWRARLSEQATIAAAKPPTAQEVQAFIAAHPEMFAARTIYLVDRLTLAEPLSPALLKALEPTHSLEAAEAVLSGQGVDYRRSVTRLDTLSLDPAISRQISQLPPNEPFVVPASPGAEVARVRASKAQPITGEGATQVARAMLIAQQRAKLLTDKAAALIKSAKITYADGFAPPK